MTDEVLASQVGYYRRRAGEYDVTVYGDVVAARARIARLVAEMRPTGKVLEITCGTGLWTEALAGMAETVTALDVAPEMMEIARNRVRANNVKFEVADVFSWETAARFDVIFFAAWLSHVPMSRFEEFWRLLRGLLAAGGRVLFIDQHVEGRDEETYLPGSDEIVERPPILDSGETRRAARGPRSSGSEAANVDRRAHRRQEATLKVKAPAPGLQTGSHPIKRRRHGQSVPHRRSPACPAPPDQPSPQRQAADRATERQQPAPRNNPQPRTRILRAARPPRRSGLEGTATPAPCRPAKTHVASERNHRKQSFHG